MSESEISVLLVAAEPELRRSLKALLATQAGVTLVAEATDPAGALTLAAQHQPHLILVDVDLAELPGPAVVPRLMAAAPAARILPLGLHVDRRFIRPWLEAGAAGYLVKYCAFEELAVAIQTLAAGEFYCSPLAAAELATDPQSHQPAGGRTGTPKIYHSPKEEVMPYTKKVKDLMIPLEDYPHIPYWFTLRQAMAIVREAAIKYEGTFEPRAVLVFDEKYQLMGMLTLRDIIRGLEPRFAEDKGLIKSDPSLAVLVGDMFGPGMKEASQKPVSEVMSPIRVTVNGDDPITKALFLMVKENVGMMPVLLDNKVVGMIRMNELFKEISDIVLGD